MTTPHTPGPWKTDKWNYPTRGERIMIVTESDAVAEMSSLWRPEATKDDPMAMAEIMANARLIAAAPELLEALQAIMAEFGNTNRRLDPDLSVDIPRILARAAIAKATNQ